MKESFRRRLKRGDLLIGTLVTLASLETAEIIAEAGFDWLFVDMEHSTLGPPQAQAILQCVGERVDCVLRVPLNDEIWIKKALDTGAAGILVPQVNSIEDARRAVRYSKYPLQGSRSVGMGRAHGYGANSQAYLDQANNNIAVIIQAEHIEAVHNIEAIITVEGIDAVLIGPYDLSASMGLMGQVDSEGVQAAIEHVRQICQAHGMPLGIFTTRGERAEAYMQQGYNLIACSCDTLLLSQAAAEMVKNLKLAVKETKKR
jgi:2-dehydro-3-deoxyglucarate aldolase/4-hydroxy-2-oxoheptanedioate aldolase